MRPALHPATAVKIRQCFASDACLPVQLRRVGPNANPNPALPPPASRPPAAASASATDAPVPEADAPALDAATVNGFLVPASAASGDLPALPAVRLGRPGELKKRVTIPDSPVTPVAARKCAALLKP